MDNGSDWWCTLVRAVIYLEGGGSSKEVLARCREGFRNLLSRCQFENLPRLVACGSRGNAFSAFEIAHRANQAEYVALWIDSEYPIDDINKTWDHLAAHDAWNRPNGTSDEQVLLSTTCMETLIVADRETLRTYYGSRMQETALPRLFQLENRDRHEVFRKLVHATRSCTNAYTKGSRSFQILGQLQPANLEKYLPSFVRIRRILGDRLQL